MYDFNGDFDDFDDVGDFDDVFSSKNLKRKRSKKPVLSETESEVSEDDDEYTKP